MRWHDERQIHCPHRLCNINPSRDCSNSCIYWSMSRYPTTLKGDSMKLTDLIVGDLPINAQPDTHVSAPDNAIGALNGLYYKIGAHDFGFYWTGNSWHKSEHHADSIRAAIYPDKPNKSFNPFSLYNEL